MKRILLMIVLILSLAITGCSSDSGDKTNDKEVNGGTEADANAGGEKGNGEQQKEDKDEDEVPINPDDLKAEIKLLDPDSIGNVYAQATYTNNTEYPITGYDLTILKKDTNEKSYLTTYDTVMPGETSPTFEASGPNTQKEEDYEILKLEVVAQLENGNELHIDYDFKLRLAEWNEYE